MYNEQSMKNNFIRIVKDVEKDFPELDIKMKVYKERVTFLNSPAELYHKSISVILNLLNQIELSLNLFPNSPVVEELENNSLKLKKALIMLILSRKDMFSKPE
ncbi:virulence factor [Candidatus Chlamydia sanziniae]|uniref:Virulence protein pGP4-D n=1 Tax=Candidatus Chlamydia sanziniae TaxID=1806891 RepID=A0A1A9HW07_9CHLA|nr:virulence factor [Candidatus Chlamydia sanziniae]ANH79178.1 Virulence protein pGP4-D [Candidatus Chlamydia sanziniae]